MRKQSILIFFIYGPGAKILAFCPPDDTVYSSFNSKTGGAMSAVGETPNGLEFIRISSHIPKNIQEGSADIIFENNDILSHPSQPHFRKLNRNDFLDKILRGRRSQKILSTRFSCFNVKTNCFNLKFEQDQGRKWSAW